jgi:SAM-dependent methyltransferase
VAASTSWQERYLRRFYDRDRGWIDANTEFHDLCSATIPPGSRILEIGAGPSNVTSRFLSGLGELHGLDPDPAVMRNDALSSAAVLTGDIFPTAPASFDACVSQYVIEHVANPLVHLQEVRRALKPGAPYIFRTPNLRYFAYQVALRTPQAFHLAVANRLRNDPPGWPEPYPTVYAMNTAAKIRALADAAGLSVDSVRFLEKQPQYGMSSRTVFLLFMLYERAVNASERLASFRGTIFSVLRRPA